MRRKLCKAVTALSVMLTCPVRVVAASPVALAEMEQALHQLNSNMTSTLEKLEATNASSKHHPDHEGDHEDKEHEQMMLAFCIIDSIQAAISLGQIGTGITEAVHVCKPHKFPDGSYGVPRALQDDCAEAITFTLTSVGHTGTFLSAAALQCATSANLQAYCAANVLDIFTSASLLAESGSGMSANCGPATSEEAKSLQNAAVMAGDGRRLGAASEFDIAPSRTTADAGHAAAAHTGSASEHGVLPDPTGHGAHGNAHGEHAADHHADERSLSIAQCVFNALQATTFLARAGTIIAEAVHACHHFEELQREQEMEEGMDSEPLEDAYEGAGAGSHEEGVPVNATPADGQHSTDGHHRRLKVSVRITKAEVDHAQRKCAVNILHAIASFSYVGSFLSFAAGQCPEMKSYEAACAGSIINVITALSATAGAAIDMENSCALIGKNVTVADEEERAAISRRLLASSSKGSEPLIV